MYDIGQIQEMSMVELMNLVENSEHAIEIDTPDGFQPIGDFFVKGQMKTLKLSFDDGTDLMCSKDHLIEVTKPIYGYDNPTNCELDGNLFSRSKWINIDDEVVSENGTKKLISSEYVDYHHMFDVEIKHPNHRFYANGVSHHNSGGKSTLAMQTCREAKKKGIVLYFDNEQAFDYNYAKSLGLVEDDNFVVYRPRSAEETEKLTIMAIEALGSAISMVVYDSVAATRTESELGRSHGESGQKSEHATFWGTFGVKWMNWASQHKIAVVLINQLRAKPMLGQNDKFSITNNGVGAGYSNTETAVSSTGGNALKYWFSARYLLRASTTLKEQIEDDATGEIDEKRVANVYRLESIKNKCFAPYKRAKYVIRFGVGTDDSSIIKDYLTAIGKITTAGSFISYNAKNPDLSFRLNGKVAFNKKFMTKEVLDDAKLQYLEAKQSGELAKVQSSEEVWGEGIAEADKDDGMKLKFVDETGSPEEIEI